MEDYQEYKLSGEKLEALEDAFVKYGKHTADDRIYVDEWIINQLRLTPRHVEVNIQGAFVKLDNRNSD